MKRLLSILLLVLAGVAQAGQSAIPDGTRWVIRVEWKRLIEGETGGIIKPLLDKPEVSTKVSEIEKVFGVNLIKDIQSVTVFGKDSNEANTVIAIKGKCDRIRVEGVFRALPGHKEQAVNARTVHLWQDNQSHAAAFSDDQTLLIGNAEGPVKQALDALDGKASASTIDENSNTETALVFCAAREIQNLKTGAPNAAILKQLFELSLLIDMNERQVGVKIDAKVGKEDIAKHVKNIAEGLRSLVILNAENDAGTAGIAEKIVAELVQKVQVKAEGATISLSVKLPIETVAILAVAVIKQAEIKAGN